jgi:Ricin-type beta-trefoil lectin domain
MRMFSFAASLIAAVCATGLAAGFETPPPPPDLIAPISLRSTALARTDCLQPINASKVAGAAIVRQTCKAAAEQLWLMTRVGNGNLHLMNVLSGLCLDARGAAVSGTPVQQWPCNQISNEVWQLNGPAYLVSFTSRVSGSTKYCLDVNDNGPSAEIYGCNNTPSQIWNINAPAFVVVPNVTGMNASAATTTVYNYGLVPDLQPPSVPKDPLCTADKSGFVIYQLPLAGNLEEAKGINGEKTGMTLTVCP